MSFKSNFLVVLIFFITTHLAGAQTEAAAKTPTIADKVKNAQKYPGYFNFYWEEESGKVWLEVDKLDQEFLYVNSLTAGVGSNDIGLDRNQLGGEHIVKFFRVGPKLMLQKINYGYRAISDNADERKSVEEAFAQAILWGFKVEAEEQGRILIDFTPFLLRDAHGVAARLRAQNQATLTLEQSRSAVYMERTKNFPKNSEFEAILTFSGEGRGAWLRSVAADPGSVTVRQHHSFVELPDNLYEPRIFDPRSGYFEMSYYDYATPISQPIVKRFIQRHRLEKKNPTAAISDPVEPIVYYVDRGAPEPIKSALIEGAAWWNQAFEAAGYRNAFIVKELPADADPMDVRYNVINWVHRSTRGWSYGSTVTDPRTGEIIKGHVTLGSLRVRQDFLIAQSLVNAYENGTTPDPRLEQMALARLRQLSAHEVGHTIGLAHNFASSYNNRASVMDYPHPYVALDGKGNVDVSKAYATGIGEWDKRIIIYGYQDFADGVNEAKALNDILEENNKMGLLYISDRDARAEGGAHLYGHLWDNGNSPAAELKRLSEVRAKALANFSEKNIPTGMPMAYLENVLVPLFLAHRYQVEATAKVVGGVQYSYAVRGSQMPTNEMVADGMQREALDALLSTLQPKFLTIPEKVIKLIPPLPIGYDRDRELFKINTGLTFDPISAAESSVHQTVRLLLHPGRLARLVEQHARDNSRLSANEVIKMALAAVKHQPSMSGFETALALMAEKAMYHQLLNLAGDKSIMRQVSALALLHLSMAESDILRPLPTDAFDIAAHKLYIMEQIRQFRANPDGYKVPEAPIMPDGAPIGCGG